MDIGNEGVQENSKYAYLLGAALRNQDTEQFFEVYDVVLPKDLTVEEVGCIKESARTIAGLSDAEFIKLTPVVRDSVGQPQESGAMSNSEQGRKNSDQSFVTTMDYFSPGLQSEEHPSQNFNPKSVSGDLEEGDGEQSDSGVFNSSKNTGGSISDTELTDECDRPGCIDYFPEADTYPKYTPVKPSSSAHNRLQHSAAYDCAEDVESDTGTPRDKEPQQSTRSPPYQDEQLAEVVVHSGPYGDSYYYGTEMTTFRTSCSVVEQNRSTRDNNSATYDEAVTVDDDDNEDNLAGVSVHQRLYRSGKSGSYSHMDAEDEEDYETDPRSDFHFTSHRPLLCHPPFPLTRKTKEIDHPISFPLNSRSTYPDKYCSSFSGVRTNRASDGTCIEERIKSKRSSPPFGDPVSVRAVNRSVEELMDLSHLQSEKLPTNLPYGAPIGNNTEESGSDERRDGTIEGAGKKRRKKKKASSKDDEASSYDVNGNPVERFSPSLGRPGHSSSSDKHVEVTNRDGRPLLRQDAPASQFPRDISSLVEYTPGCSLGNTEMQSSSDPQGKHSRRTVRKKREENNTVKSENIPGHRGSESNLDALLDFIENNQGGKKKKKLLPVQNGPQTILDKDKTNNIKKTKKGKSVCGKDGSEKAGSENGSEKSDEYINHDFSDEKLKICVNESSSTSGLKDSMVPLTKLSDNNMTVSHSLDLFDDGGGYIFTDFDSVRPVEEEFQVVSKPKKKKQQRPGPSPQSSYRESSLDFSREERGRSRRPLRSITPPPTPTASQEKPSERAFSPSAFPVLSGRPREGRRNSTGNAPCEANLDDSDMESVKSLPLVAGSSSTSTKTSGTTSPGSGRPQVISYAKIAAAPKPSKVCSNVSCPNTVNVSPSASGVAAGLPMTQVDPPTERRHSFDSIPQSKPVASLNVDSQLGGGSFADNVQGDTNVITKNFPLQPPTRTSISCVRQESSHTVALPENNSENDISVASNTSSSKCQSSCMLDCGSKVEKVEPTAIVKLDFDTDFPHISKNISPNKVVALQQPKSKNSVVNNKKLINSKNVSTQNLLVGNQDKSLVSSSLSCAASMDDNHDASILAPDSAESGVVTTKPPVGPKVTNNHKKLRVQKPVYFFDTKLNKPPKNLGISFGFDHDLAILGPLSQLDGPGVSSNNTSDIGDEGVRSKTKEELAGLNGLVVGYTQSLEATLTTCPNPLGVAGQAQQNRNTDTSSADTLVKPSMQGQHHWNTSMPYTPPAPNVCMPQFGDVKISHYTNYRARPVGQDPNYDRSMFNVEETVRFLKKEWDCVMEIRAKDPQRVLYYLCD